MRPYSNISNPTIGDIKLALYHEGSSFLITEQDMPVITDRLLCPNLYSVMTYIEEQGYQSTALYEEIPF